MDKNKKSSAINKDLKEGKAASKSKEDNKSKNKTQSHKSTPQTASKEIQSKAMSNSKTKDSGIESKSKSPSAKSPSKEILKAKANKGIDKKTQAKTVKKTEIKKAETKSIPQNTSKLTIKKADKNNNSADQKVVSKTSTKIVIDKTTIKEKPKSISPKSDKKKESPIITKNKLSTQNKANSQPATKAISKKIDTNSKSKEATVKKPEIKKEKPSIKIIENNTKEKATKVSKEINQKEIKGKEIKVKNNKIADQAPNQLSSQSPNQISESDIQGLKDSTETNIPKKRGRKPKPKTEESEIKIPKKRGRKKSELSIGEESPDGELEDGSEDPLSLDGDLDDLLSPIVAKRRPGRPPKVRTAADMATFKLPSPSARIIKREPLKPKKPLSSSLPGTSLAGLLVSASSTSPSTDKSDKSTKTKADLAISGFGHQGINHENQTFISAKTSHSANPNTSEKDEDDNSRPSWALRDWVTRKGERLIIKSNELVKEEQFDALSSESSYGVVSQAEVDDVIRRIRESYKKKVNPKKPNAAPEL